LNLKLILDSQRELSHLLATRVAATAPEMARVWTKRSETYAALHREARNIGGPIGTGGAAVAEAANAVNRLRRLPATSPLTVQAVADLDILLLRVDGHVADLIERGARECLYFAPTKLPRIVENDGNLIHGVRERFMPLSTSVRSDLIRFARALRQPIRTSGPPATARANHLEFEAAIRHRPTQRPDPGLAL